MVVDLRTSRFLDTARMQHDARLRRAPGDGLCNLLREHDLFWYVRGLMDTPSLLCCDSGLYVNRKYLLSASQRFCDRLQRG